MQQNSIILGGGEGGKGGGLKQKIDFHLVQTHIVLLVAKRRLLKNWLEADLPTRDMLVSQIKFIYSPTE